MINNSTKWDGVTTFSGTTSPVRSSAGIPIFEGKGEIILNKLINSAGRRIDDVIFTNLDG